MCASVCVCVNVCVNICVFVLVCVCVLVFLCMTGRQSEFFLNVLLTPFPL